MYICESISVFIPTIKLMLVANIEVNFTHKKIGNGLEKAKRKGRIN